MTSTLPLADVKILDLMWVMAGPAGTRVLADYGATLVRVESSKRIDTARTSSPSITVSPGQIVPRSIRISIRASWDCRWT